MNAKELRQAAEYTVTMWDNHDSKRIVAGDELFQPGYSDEITPQRLVEAGFSMCKFRDGTLELYGRHCCVRVRLKTGCWWIADVIGCELTVAEQMKPRNMGEVWELIERCKEGN